MTPVTRAPWQTPTIDAVTDTSGRADDATAAIRNGVVVMDGSAA